MNRVLIKLSYIVRCLFYIPHYVIMAMHSKRKVIEYEACQYCKKVLHSNDVGFKAFFKVIVQIPDFRNLYFSRMGNLGLILRPFTCVRTNLNLFTPDDKIGKGLILHHAYSTAILCRQLGTDCEIWQGVTIGKSKSSPGLEGTPAIGSNVKISAGAIVIGRIYIGNNSIIGAGALVTKDVPENVTVIGNPAYIIRRNALRVNEKL